MNQGLQMALLAPPAGAKFKHTVCLLYLPGLTRNTSSSKTSINWTGFTVELCRGHLATHHCYVSKWNFWMGCRPACISPQAHILHRSRNKAQGAASKCQESQYPKGASSLIPKPLPVFKALLQHRSSSVSALNALLCIHTPPHTPLWWVKVEPECITWSPKYMTKRPGLSETCLGLSRGAIMMLRGQKHVQGADFIFLLISQRLFTHFCVKTQRAARQFQPMRDN